ncbi:MAG: hypothetical protein ACFFC6_13505 [Promethearchaeota archaeon]
MSESEPISQEKNYKDVLDYTPAVLKVISDEKTLKALLDNNYEKILHTLRNKHMTVQEITTEFNKLAEKCIMTDPKSDKTVYRYLKTLEELELVAPAGQRVIIGKTATEKLYTRTARIFQQKEIDWMSERGEEWVKRFTLLMGYMIDNNGQKPSIRCIQEFFKKMSEAKIVALERLAQSASDDIVKQITEGEWEELVAFIDWVFLFGSLMNQPELLEELGVCLNKKTPGD